MVCLLDTLKKLWNNIQYFSLKKKIKKNFYFILFFLPKIFLKNFKFFAAKAFQYLKICGFDRARLA
jgi:hypothetical protein